MGNNLRETELNKNKIEPGDKKLNFDFRCLSDINGVDKVHIVDQLHVEEIE